MKRYWQAGLFLILFVLLFRWSYLLSAHSEFPTADELWMVRSGFFHYISTVGPIYSLWYQFLGYFVNEGDYWGLYRLSFALILTLLVTFFYIYNHKRKIDPSVNLLFSLLLLTSPIHLSNVRKINHFAMAILLLVYIYKDLIKSDKRREEFVCASLTLLIFIRPEFSIFALYYTLRLLRNRFSLALQYQWVLIPLFFLSGYLIFAFHPMGAKSIIASSFHFFNISNGTNYQLIPFEFNSLTSLFDTSLYYFNLVTHFFQIQFFRVVTESTLLAIPLFPTPSISYYTLLPVLFSYFIFRYISGIERDSPAKSHLQNEFYPILILYFFILLFLLIYSHYFLYYVVFLLHFFALLLSNRTLSLWAQKILISFVFLFLLIPPVAPTKIFRGYIAMKEERSLFYNDLVELLYCLNKKSLDEISVISSRDLVPLKEEIPKIRYVHEGKFSELDHSTLESYDLIPFTYNIDPVRNLSGNFLQLFPKVRSGMEQSFVFVKRDLKNNFETCFNNWSPIK